MPRISQQDMNELMFISAGWKEKNPCNLCWHGPCMCNGIQDTTHKVIPSGKSQPGLGYKGMAYTDPKARAMIDADTAAFRAEMKSKIRGVQEC